MLGPWRHWRPAHRWTARAFDRCALMAVIYPFASLLAIWTLTGKAGDIGEILGLRPEVDWWWRWMGAVALVVSTFSYVRSLQTSGWRSFLWFLDAVTVAGAGAVLFVTIWLYKRAIGTSQLGVIWSLHFIIMIVLGFFLAWLAAKLDVPPNARMLAVMIGLVPLLNIPFDWL